MSCAASTATELMAAGGGNALLLTHSTVIESLLASHFKMRFDSVHTTNLAHLVVLGTPAHSADGWQWSIEHISGIMCDEVLTTSEDASN